jgi:hypothetical protein
VPTEVNDARRVDRGVAAVRLEERGLVDAELAHPAHPAGVIDQRGAVLDDGVHDRPPAHPELLGHRGHRTGELADLAARLRAGTAGQHHLRVQMRRRLGPGPAFTQRFAAPPPPLAPHQPRGATEARQIAHRDLDAIMGLCPGAAVVAAHERGRGLDPDHHLVGGLGHREHPEPGESQQRLGQSGTVVHAGASSSLVAVRQPQRWRGPCPAWWTLPRYLNSARSPLIRVEPVKTAKRRLLPIVPKKRRSTVVPV